MLSFAGRLLHNRETNDFRKKANGSWVGKRDIILRSSSLCTHIGLVGTWLGDDIADLVDACNTYCVCLLYNSIHSQFLCTCLCPCGIQFKQLLSIFSFVIPETLLISFVRGPSSRRGGWMTEGGC